MTKLIIAFCSFANAPKTMLWIRSKTAKLITNNITLSKCVSDSTILIMMMMPMMIKIIICNVASHVTKFVRV
jgi:hypothetical protein